MRRPYHQPSGLSAGFAGFGDSPITIPDWVRFPTGSTLAQRFVAIRVRLARKVNLGIRRDGRRPVATRKRLGRDRRGPLEKDNRRFSKGEPAELVSGA